MRMWYLSYLSGGGRSGPTFRDKYFPIDVGLDGGCLDDHMSSIDNRLQVYAQVIELTSQVWGRRDILAPDSGKPRCRSAPYENLF
jgi:hypothetical protein